MSERDRLAEEYRRDLLNQRWTKPDARKSAIGYMVGWDACEKHKKDEVFSWKEKYVDQIEKAEALVEVLEDFEKKGTRHDVFPTTMWRNCEKCGPVDLGPPRTKGYQGYIQEMDKYVRDKARQALADYRAEGGGHEKD